MYFWRLNFLEQSSTFVVKKHSQGLKAQTGDLLYLVHIWTSMVTTMKSKVLFSSALQIEVLWLQSSST